MDNYSENVTTRTTSYNPLTVFEPTNDIALILSSSQMLFTVSCSNLKTRKD